MARGSGLAALAAGFSTGYVQGKQLQHKQELEERRLKIDETRAALENQKLEDDRAMREKLARLEEDVKPTAGFVVDTPQGRHIYTDEKTAHAAADAANVQARPVFLVAGQPYDDKASADVAAEAQNSPAARLRKKASVYSSFGREDLAAAAMSNYRATLDNNRREMQQAFLNARATGDVQAVIDAYNKQLPNGVDAELIQGQDGKPLVQLSRGGKPVGQPQPFDWDLMQQQVMATPDNMLEIYKTNQDLKLRERGIRVQEGQLANDTTRTGAQVRHLDAQTADIPLQARDRATQAGAAATSAGAAATNAQTSRAALVKPTISAAPDAKGGLNFVQTQPTFDPKTGTFGMSTPVVKPATGLQYPAGYVASQRNAGLGAFGLGSPGQVQVDPNAVQSVLEQLQGEARRRAAARTLGPSASGVVQ